MQKCSKVNYNFSFSLSSVAATLLQVKVKLLLFYIIFVSFRMLVIGSYNMYSAFSCPHSMRGLMYFLVGENGWLALLCKLNLI